VKWDFDAVVVGAGPCGAAAALQLRRSGATVGLFERRSVGGLLRNARLVENYPGFPGGITGERFCTLLGKQLAVQGIEPIHEAVASAEPVAGGYAIATEAGGTATCRVLIAATGTRPRTGLLEEPSDLVGRKIFYEVADIKLPRTGASVLVVGGGDAAYDYSLNLADRGAEVTILRRGEPRCLPLLLERARAGGKVKERAGAATMAVACEGSALSVRIEDRGEISELSADFLLVACGRIPEDALLRSLAPDWRIDARLPGGLLTGGDLVRGLHRQAGIAVGDGLAAAMAAAEYLKERSDTECK